MVVEEICVSRLDTPDGSVPIGWCVGVCSVDEVLRLTQPKDTIKPNDSPIYGAL